MDSWVGLGGYPICILEKLFLFMIGTTGALATNSNCFLIDNKAYAKYLELILLLGITALIC